MGKLSKISLGLLSKQVSFDDVTIDQEQIEKSLKSCERYVGDRKKQTLGLINNLQEIITTRESLVASFNEMSPLLKKLEDSYADLTERRELEVKKNDLYSKEASELQNRIDIYKKDTEKSQKEINLLLDQNEDIEAKINILKAIEIDEKAKHAFFEKRLREAQTKNKALLDQKEKIWKSSEKVKSEFEVIQKRIETFQEDIRNLSREKIELENSITNYRLQAKESELKAFDLSHIKSKNEDEVRELRAGFKKSKEVYTKHKEEFLKFQNEIKELQDSKKDIISKTSDLEKDLQNLNKILHERQIEREISYNDVHDSTQRFLQVKKEHTVAADEIKQMQYEIESFTTQKIELAQKTQDYKKFLLEAHDQKESWAIKHKREEKIHASILEEYLIEKEKFDKVNNEYLLHKSKAQNLKKDYIDLKEKIESFNQTKSDLIEKTFEEKQTIQALKLKNSELEASEKNLQEEIHRNRETLLKVSRAKENVRIKHEEALKKLSDTEAKRQDQSTKIEFEQKNILFLKDETAKVEDEIREVERKIETINKKITSEEVERSRTKNILGQTKNKLSQTVELRLQREKVYDQAILATNDVKANVESVEAELIKHNLKIENLNLELKNLKGSVVDLNRSYNEKRSLCISAQAKLKKISDEISAVRNEKKMKDQSANVLVREIEETKKKIIASKNILSDLSSNGDFSSSRHNSLKNEFHRLNTILLDWNEKINLKEKEIEVIQMRDIDYTTKVNELQSAIDAKRREHTRLEEKLKLSRKSAQDHAYITTSLEKAISEVENKISYRKQEIEKVQNESLLHFSASDEKTWKEYKNHSRVQKTLLKLIEEVQNQEFETLEIDHILTNRFLEGLSGKLTLKNLASRVEEIKLLTKPFAATLKNDGVILKLKSQIDKNQVCRVITIDWEVESEKSVTVNSQIN